MLENIEPVPFPNSPDPSDPILTPVDPLAKSELTLGLEFGFQLVKVGQVEEVDGEVRIYRHIKTGAEVAFVLNKDPNKYFSINFRTAAENNKGTPHVAEHMAFRGSLRYPGIDPLNDYLQQSLKSESNAETGHDYTTFYGASLNKVDLRYQFEITLDGVLNGLYTDQAFRQECWRVEKTNGVKKEEVPTEPAAENSEALTPSTNGLGLNGIVLNEMKDYYSQPMEAHNLAVIKNLFPDTYYEFDPAGDPKAIPTLVNEEVRSFTRKHYHPSNAKFVFYGDLDRSEFLELLGKALEPAEKAEINIDKPVQPRFIEPRRVEGFYPGGEKEDAGRDSIVSVSWGLGQRADLPNEIDLLVLEYLLTGNKESPIKKALYDADLGEDLIEDCLSQELYEAYITLGVTGTGASKTDEIEGTILNALQETVRSGFPPELINYALDYVEFGLLQDQIAADRGGEIIEDLLLGWYQGQDPVECLAWKKSLTELRSRLEANPRYFEELVERMLVRNYHRLTTTIRPKRGLADDWTEAEHKLANKLGEEAIVTDDPSPPDISERLPKLKIADLTRKCQPVEVYKKDGIWCYPVKNTDLVRFSIALSFRAVPQELLPYLRVFSDVMGHLNVQASGTGTFLGKADWSEFCLSNMPDSELDTRLSIGAETTGAKAEALIQKLIHNITTEDLDRKKEIYRLLVEAKAEIEDEIQADPFGYALTRVAAKIDRSELLDELLTGTAGLSQLLQSIADTKNRWSTTLDKLLEVRSILCANGQPEMYLAGNEATIEKLLPILKEIAAKFGPLPSTLPTWNLNIPNQPEGIVTPSQVMAVAQGFDLRGSGFNHHGSILVLNELLERAYYWPTIRREFGAYSPKLEYHRNSGILSVGSASDARPADTLNVIEHTSAWLRSIAPKIKELRRSKIGAIGTLDEPSSPFEVADTNFIDRLRQLPLDFREVERGEIFDAVAKHVLELADALERVQAKPLPTVIIGSRKELNKLNRHRPGNELEISALT